MSEYDVRLYESGMASEVADLRRRTWGHSTALNRKYLEWKYDRNPYVSPRMMAVALDGGRVVGMRGVLGTLWESDAPESPHVLPCAADFIIEPTHRRSGLYERLTAFVLDELEGRGFTHMVNTSASAENYVASVVVLGWRPAGGYERFTYKGPSEAGPSKRSLAGRVAHRLRPPAAGAFAAFDRAADVGATIEASAEPRPEVLSAVAQSVDHGGRLRHVRDSVYFGWRFSNPISVYRFLYAGGDDPAGYLILQSMRAEVGTVHILDWEARNPAVHQELLDEALRRGSFDTVRIATASLPEEAVARLRRAGFVHDEPSGHGRGSKRFLVRPIGNLDDERWSLGDRRLDDAGAWDLRLLFSDQF